LNSEFIVADTSVLLKWFLHSDEPYREQALLLFGRFKSGDLRILLPELALYELGNRLLRLPSSGLELFLHALELLTDIVPFEAGEMKGLAESIARLHARGLKKITFYDGAYIYVALLTECPLLTADVLQAKAGQLLNVSAVLLKDYQ